MPGLVTLLVLSKSLLGREIDGGASDLAAIVNRRGLLCVCVCVCVCVHVRVFVPEAKWLSYTCCWTRAVRHKTKLAAVINPLLPFPTLPLFKKTLQEAIWLEIIANPAAASTF